MKLLLSLSRLLPKRLSARRFLKDRAGVAMVEFALILPLLLLLIYGTFEVGRYALLIQKLDRISATIADLTARAEALTATEVTNLFNSVNHLSQPFDFNTSGIVMVTSVVGRAGKTPLIIGQKSKGSISGISSEVGVNGGSALLPAAFKDVTTGQVLQDGEGLIVSEVFYDFKPYFSFGSGSFLANLIPSTVIARKAFFRPRLSEQTTFN
jgi:Flp pilus assembly pilin Flp